MLDVPRGASPGLVGTIALSLLLAGCVLVGCVAARATPTPLVPPGVPTPGPDQQVRVTDHFVIYYTAEASPAQVSSVASYLEAAWRDIPPFLGIEPPSSPIRVYIGGLDLGASHAFPTRVIVFELSDFTDGYAVVPHEFTHILTGYSGPQWMEEGLAMYMEERFAPGGASTDISVDSWSMGLLRAGKWVTLWEFPVGRPSYTSWEIKFSVQRAYWESGSLVMYLIQTYGLSAFWKMHDDINGWFTAEGVYGKDIDTLVEEWRQCLANSAIPSEDCPECIASYLEGGDLWAQFEAGQGKLNSDVREQVTQEFGAMSEALRQKDAQAMQRHLDMAQQLMQTVGDE